MPKYQYANPFDLIRTIKGLQATVKQLQIQMPNPAPAIPIGNWTALSLATGWINGNVSTVQGVKCRYWGAPFNLCEIMGDIVSTTLSGTHDAFTLSGAAPTVNQNHDIMNNAVAIAAWLWVQTSGVVQVVSYTTNIELGIHVFVPLGTI